MKLLKINLIIYISTSGQKTVLIIITLIVILKISVDSL
jgi:hypothetical protein